MTYEIRQNTQYNSLEIYFDGKPSEAVREVLKAHKFRWHSVKRCWYGYGTEEAIAAAITGTTTDDAPASVVVDAIIRAYRYDCSNGMVDYFDTNFYYDICLKPVAA